MHKINFSVSGSALLYSAKDTFFSNVVMWPQCEHISKLVLDIHYI